MSYTWNGVGMHTNGLSAAGTTISSSIAASGLGSFTVTNIAKLDVSDLPTRVYVSTSMGQWEEIWICTAVGNTLTPCYDGRGYADSFNGRVAAKAWSSGADIGQFKVKGTGTAFLTTLCRGGAHAPVGLVKYSTGTATLTAGSANVVGAGTTWLAPPADYWVGNYLVATATHSSTPFVFVAQIATMTDATHLVLTRPFPADADTGTYSYKIISSAEANASARLPVLHYTRGDGSDGMSSLPGSYGCESDTSMYMYPAYEKAGANGVLQSAKSYSYMDGNWWINQGSTGGLNFYGEDLAHRALYYRSGLDSALTAANMIGNMWVRMPMIDGQSSGSPLFSGGLAIGGFADAMLSSAPHKTQWSDLRGFAQQGVYTLASSCNVWDSRDTGYQLSWLSLAALFDPDTVSTAAPGGLPWRTYWRNQLSAMYTRELGCKRSDNSWASGMYWNNYGDQIVLTNGSAIGTGTNISNNTCFGATSGTGTATNGSGVLTGTGFTSGTRIVITGTRSGQPFTMWQYYTLNSSSQITLNLGATWQGDTGPISWMVDNANNLLTFGQNNDDAMLAKNWSCIKDSTSQITLNRPWTGPTGTYGAYTANVAGISQQPYMLGIRQKAWEWAAMAATDMGNTTLATNFNALRTLAGTWVKSTGFDSLVTNGMYYGRVSEACEPITPASMSGSCFEDNPSNSDYDKVAMRELTAESSASLRSYSDSVASDAVTWGDLAYGSLWGQPQYTTGGVYAPTDGDTIANSANANTSWASGKWTGFFFGMGMAHQWPAIRLGSVSIAPTTTARIRGLRIRGAVIR